MPFQRLVRKCPKPKGTPREAKTLGEHVKARRLAAGLHQAELASRLDVDEFTVLSWENGHTIPRIGYYSRIVAYLGYDPMGKGETLPEKMKAYRRREDIDQKVAGRRLGVGGKSWCAWESEKRAPSLINEARLRRLLGGDPSPWDDEPRGILHRRVCSLCLWSKV